VLNFVEAGFRQVYSELLVICYPPVGEVPQTVCARAREPPEPA